jgi:di/tricarboxylate transporter
VSDAGIVFSILAATVILFVWNRFPVEIVAVGASLALVATGILELDQAVAGFGDPTVVFIASLFIVSAALDGTGVTAWAGEQLAAIAGGDRARLLAATMVLCAALTAIISVNGAVAALLPMVVVLAVRQRLPTSQLLMPLAFAAHAGSMLALTGTPVNVLVSNASLEAGTGRFGFFEFALVGVPLLIGTITITLVVGPRLLPTRTPRTLPADLSAHARTLREQYLGEGSVYRLRVRPGGTAVDRALDQLVADMPPSLELVGVQIGGRTELTQPDTLRTQDVVIVRGPSAEVQAFAEHAGLLVAGPPSPPDGTLVGRSYGVAELVVPPRSGLIGATLFPGMITDSGDLVILAVQRRGEDLGPTASEIEVGDTLLVQGEWHALDREIDIDRDVLAVDEPARVRSQAVPFGPKSWEAIGVTAMMVGLLASGVVPPAAAGLLAAGLLVLLGVLTMPQLYHAISWTTVVLVAGMIPVSTAMQVSGAADDVAQMLVDLVGDAGPRALLLGIFLLAAAMGAVISNTATALVLIPVAISAANDLDVSPKPILLGVGIAAAAAFLTPVSTAVNLMVMGPGGYRFGDYWKFGLPLLTLYGIVVVLYVPLIWSF